MKGCKLRIHRAFQNINFKISISSQLFSLFSMRYRLYVITQEFQMFPIKVTHIFFLINQLFLFQLKIIFFSLFHSQSFVVIHGHSCVLLDVIHVFFCRQLQVLMSFVLVLSAVSLMCLDECRMRLLWLSMICLALFMQL